MAGSESPAACTCGQGDDKPAICHDESCPRIDWLAGSLEGDSAATWHEKDRVRIIGKDFNGEHGLIAWVDPGVEKVGVWIAGFETGDMPITFRFSEVESRDR